MQPPHARNARPARTSAPGATRARARTRLNATRSLHRPVGGDRRVIVVGYDATPQARPALAFAARGAGRQGTVLAVHAVAPAHGYLGQPYYNRAVERAQLKGRAILDDVPATGGSAVETALLEGRAAASCWPRSCAPCRACLGGAQITVDARHAET
jgi:hypothetical protein